ncbi:MAG TPA: aminotransferase class I/II-fold pyridoxal phosphate-dependent enzyme [Thermomicrobiales bacterium]|nr:aminotransferase class I/II-fold pyridoxal phosphate-dependent enzyme [Thermomicrobiales bacterium]
MEMVVEEQTGSPLRRRLASRVGMPAESVRTRMLEIAATRNDVIALGRGDPDLPTPRHIVEAAKSALDQGATHYTHPAGDLALRRAMSEHIARVSGVDYDPATEIIVTLGAQEAVYLATLTLLEEGDEVLLASHRFTSYDMAVELAGGRVAVYPSVIDGDFALHPEAVAGAWTPRSKLLAIVSPDNPTGGVADPDQIAGCAQLAIERDLLVISDEIYSQFIYDDGVHASIAAQPGMRERSLIANGLSKCYAMTGWRVGYLAGPADYIRAILEVKHTLSICTPAISQMAALAALTGPQDCIAEMRAIYDDRRHTLMAALLSLDLPFVRPRGAFYVYVDVSSTGLPSPDFCLRLLQDTGVMIFPGTMFGSDGDRWVRMSLLAPKPQIEAAVERIEGALVSYRGG